MLICSRQGFHRTLHKPLQLSISLQTIVTSLMPPSHLSGTACGSLRLRNATNRTKILAVIAERRALPSAYLTVTVSLSFVNVALTEYATIRKYVRF